MQVLPAFADVISADALTSVSSPTGNITVQTSNIQGSTAFNQFSEFNVGATDVVNLYQPLAANKLVNIISGGSSLIDGAVNANLGIPGASAIGGNVYFVNSDGFVVSSTGVINAGQLTLSTPTAAFVTDLTAEANGNFVLGSPTQELFAGAEPLNAAGVIDIQGKIFATRLDMRAGLRMIVDGRIQVETSTALGLGPISPAVNAEGVPTAGGVSIGAGGVIRLLSKGEMRVSGNVSARRSTAGLQPHGGLVEAISDGAMTVGGTIDVTNGAGDAGSVMMFTRGSATMEPALTIKASATAGSGGFFALRAVGDINNAQGAINTGSTGGTGGEAFLIGENITVTGALTTGGGSLGIRGVQSVTVAAGAGISTRAANSGNPFTGTASADAAGDLIIASPTISVEAGATLRADSTGVDNGGMLALVARNSSTGIVWAINSDAEVATITIDQADIVGGTVVISAVAEVSNSLGSLDETVEATQVQEMEDSSTEEEFEQMLASVLTTTTLAMERGLTTLNGLIPLQVQVLSADARVTITDSTITADGNWAAKVPTAQDAATEFAANGYLSPTGLREDTYEFLASGSLLTPLLGNDNAYQMNIKLPSVFDTANDSLLIHSHAQNEMSIAPLTYGLGLAVAATDTNSQVDIRNTTLLTNVGNTRLASTAMENHTINIAAKKIANGAAALAVSVRNLTNQLLVDGGSINSAGGLNAGAFTGRNLSLTTIANSGQEGRIAIAVNVDISTSMTEAALGGTINTGGDVTLDAETLFFNVAHTTTATMGLANVAKVVSSRRNSTSALTNFSRSLNQQATDKPPADPHFGMGVAIDVQLSDDNTYASLGGNYHDLADANWALTALSTTQVTATGYDVAVNAAYRFADRGNEGGGGLTRTTSAAFGSLTFTLQRMVDRHNNKPANVNNQITKEDLLGSFSNALMLNASISSMVGETQAEVGSNATVTAGSLNVHSVTRFPNTNPVGSLINQWDNYVDLVTDYSPVTPANGSNPPEPEAPPVPDIAGFIDIVNPLTYLTTNSKTKAETPGDVVDGEEQALAIGVSVTFFNTENTSIAVIRDGATVIVDTEANVSAVQEALFLHVTNLPKSNPLGGDAKVNDAIGGGIHVGRTVSDVRAEIESGASVTVNTGDLDVTATTKNIAVSLAYSGGQGTDVAVNVSIAAQVSEADTVARIGEAAMIKANTVRIIARDDSVSWSSAGAISGSENIGVGVSGVINFSSRNIWAGIGSADRTAALAAATGTVIDAQNLEILAENNTTDITVGVAGTKVAGQPDPAEGQDPAPSDEDDDMIIPSWLFDDDEDDALAAQQNVDTPEDQSGQQQKSGWAVSGAAVLNLSLQNETSAEILTNNKITLTGNLDLNARNTAVGVNIGGAVSAGLGSGQDTNALAGAFAVHVDERILRSRIVGAEINAGGNVIVDAHDLATVVNIAVGGAGTSRGDLALAGSVAWAQLTGETTAEVLNSEITSAALTVKADDQSTTVGVGGAVGVNMDATQGYGAGVGVAYINVNRSALAQVSGTGFVNTGAFLTQADARQSVYGFGISAGVGKTGLAGSISVNLINGGAKARVLGTAADPLIVKADSVTIDATENNVIFSIGGALAGGRSTAVGGALTVNVITATTEARLDDAIVTKRDTGPELGAVNVTSDSTSVMTSIAVAGAAAIDGNAAGVGLSGNEITANTTTSLERSSVVDAASISATADSSRIIHSLGGGVAVAGGNGAGVAATVNLLLANNTKVILDHATLNTRGSGAILATSVAGGEIASLAVGISASASTSIGGAITVNVTTAETSVSANSATVTAGGLLTLKADDTATISSLAGGAALSSGGTGVGGAVAANFINHDTNVLANGGNLTGNGVTLQAVNESTINSMAVGLAAASSNAFSGSIAIGNIGNTTRAKATNTVLNAGTGVAQIDAGRTGEINILSGSAAVGGSNAFGAALTVATIHGGVTADLITSQSVTGTSLDVTARNTAEIDALAVSGAVGAGGAGGAGSLVYTQIGRPAPDGPSVDPLPGPAAGDPLGSAQTAVTDQRNQAITDLGNSLSGNGSPTNVSTANIALTLDTDDIVRARVELTGTNPNLPSMNITATETTTTRSLAGAVGVGVSSAGFGAGIAVNLMFGKAEAELVLPSGQTTTADGAVNVEVTQTGTVETAGVAGGGGGSVGGAGSVTVNVMNRQAMARIVGSTSAATGILQTGGGAVGATVAQSGTIKSLAGAVGIGGTAGFGGAIVVNVISDDAYATVEDVQIVTRDIADPASTPLQNAGTVSITADQTMTLEALAAAVAGSGTGAFAGSFAVNVADGNVVSTLRNAAVRANALTVNAQATPTLVANAGAIAASGTAAVGLGIVTNVTRQTVRADVDSATVRAHDAIRVTADSTGSMTGNAVAGSASGTASVTGSGIGNSAENIVEALVRDTDTVPAGTIDPGSDIVTAGSVLIAASGSNVISLLGGTDENPGLNINFSGGGVAGVGASASVNTLQNDVRAAVEGNTRIIGLGHRAISTRLGSKYGVVIDAYGSSSINMVTANGAVGGVAGVSALFSFNLIDDKARVQIGNVGSGALVRINPADTGLAADIGTTTPNALQDTTLNAMTTNTVMNVVANVAVGGYAGVGAGSGNTLVTNLAEVSIADAVVAANDDINITSSTFTDLDTVVLGLGGGFVGVTANANVNRIGSRALVSLDGATLNAGDDLNIITSVTSDSYGLTGGVAGGVVGAAGGVQVTLFDSTSSISVGRGSSVRSGSITAGDNMVLHAGTVLINDGNVVSGAVGAGGIALAANISLIKATTTVDIGNGQLLTSGNSMALEADDSAMIKSIAGAVGAGATGVGASLDYVNFAGTTKVLIGNNSTISANAATTADFGLTIAATSRRDVDSAVAAIGAGGISLSGAISVIEMGAGASDSDGKRDDFLADVQTELASDQSGSSGQTGSEAQNTGGSLVAFAGGTDTQNRIVTSRQAVDLVGAPEDDVVKVEIGTSSVLSTRGSLNIDARSTTAVKQLAGAGSVSLFGGATSGIAVVNVGTGAVIAVGNNSRLAADRDLNLNANNEEISGRDVIDSLAATVGASGGYNVGVGVSVATLSSASTIIIGDNVDLTGLVASRAANINLIASRSGRIKSDVFNLSLGFVGGVGVAVSTATNTGLSSIIIGANPALADTRILGNTVTIRADDTTRAVAEGEGSTGGIIGGLNSVIIASDVRSSGIVNTTNTVIRAREVTIENKSAASASADASGVAVGAVAIGASVAKSNMQVNLATNITATILSENITMRTSIYRDGFDHSTADASSTSGGLLAGNGAEAEAFADYTVTANYAGVFNASNRVLIETDAAPVVSNAYATGRSGGLVAIGVTIARAGQSSGGLSTVAASVNNATIDSHTLVVRTGNAPSSKATANSGSGGIISGSGAETRVTTNTTTMTNLGNSGSFVVDANTVQISTGQTATLGSKVDTVSAAVVGASGADSRTNATSGVITRIGSNARITAENFDISANNAVNRPKDEFNIKSGSGGAIDVSAMISKVDVSATTDLFITSGAELIQTGLSGNNQTFNLGTFTNMAIVDRLKLDAGGAIAIPVGNSDVKVNTNRATVTVGAAKIFSIDNVTIYSGGNANLLSEVDTKSYGLAGAASALTEAVYNAENRVLIDNGAMIEALNDVRLQAGFGARQAQSVIVNAESRVFNKTAFPIGTDPRADATASTNSIVDIREGARVIAVRDVYLLAEEGHREVIGYGRGKDLYREVLAAIGTAFSEAFGGEAVSLDIETGTSTNVSNDGILVNGYVRAGSRNRQILILDENNQLDNASITDPTTGQYYTDAMAEGIDYSIRKDVSLVSEIQERINLLNTLINDPILGEDAAAVIAWEAEKTQLLARVPVGNPTADFIDLEDIIAAEGNIIIRADYVHGTNTGTLDAPGNAQIRIHVWSDAYLSTAGMIIPENAGGRITFNDITVTTPAQIAALSDPTRIGPIDYNMISGAGAGDPLIEVVTYGAGSMIVDGNIYNADGIARFTSNFGDLDVRADISARTVQLSAGRDFIQGFTWGFTEVDGDPREIYETYYDNIEAEARSSVLRGATVTGTPVFNLAPRRGKIRAGRNVYISADKLNINGLIQAGIGSYKVDIAAGLDGYIADLVAKGVSGPVLLHNPAEPVNENVVRNAFIQSDVIIKYEPNVFDEFGNKTGQIVIYPMIVQGGVVELVGQVFSTGGGEIKSLDGFGRIDVNSESTLPIELGRMDLGELGELGQGVEGVVRITDTSRTTAGGDFLITEFRRVGSQFEMRDNTTFDVLEIDFNDDTVVDATRIIPTNLVMSSTANDGRSGVYQPTPDQDLVINRSETVTQVTKKRQTTFYFWAPLSSSVKSNVGKVHATPLSPLVAPGLNGVYLADSLAGADYAYHFTGRRVTNSNTSSPVITNNKRVLGIGDVVKTWSVTQTATHLYTHRLKADYQVKITFDGADQGGLNIINQGHVILTGVVNNQVGNSAISSALGSVLTSDSSVLLTVGNLDVAALGGRIGGYSTAFRVDQVVGTKLTAVARNSIDIRETSGDMIVVEARTTNRSASTGNDINGEVTLTSDGSILMADGTSLITGSEINLRSFNGGFGTDAQSVRINVDGVSLSARARNDIFIEETVGNLPVRTVVSDTGSVELAALDGSILDRNDIETRDIRTESQLASLWTDELNLNGVGLQGRKDEQIAAIKAERERAYEDYWVKRKAAPVGQEDQVFELADAQALLDGGWSQVQLDAYINDRNVLYVMWNNEAAYDTSYEYLLSVDEQVALLDGIEWTTDELDQWVREGLIRGTGDTNVRVEDPNVSAAGDITLIARDEIGELLPEYLLGSGSGLAEDLRVLSGAERADITIDTVANTVLVRRAEDLNFAFTRLNANGHAVGNLRVSSADAEIFLGAETAATIAKVIGTSDVQIKIDGAMIDNRDGSAAVRGSAIIVESGNTSPIGTPDNPLTFDILPGGSLIARSGVDVNIHAIGNMPLQEVFSGARAQISAVGAITDDTATGAVRVRAADLVIDGGSVGTDAAPLVIELTDTSNGRLDLTTRIGDAYVTSQSNLPISNVNLAGGGRITAIADASLTSANTISFGLMSTLALILPTGLDLSASSGTDIAGGTLQITSGGGLGTSAKRLQTALASLSFTASGTENTPLFVNEADALRIETITQTHVDADTNIIAGGSVSIGTVNSVAEFILLAQAITDGRIIAERTDLTANGVVPSSIGGTSRIDITTGAFVAKTANGDIIVLLRDRATNIESMTAGGTGLIDLLSTNAPLTLLVGTGISTNGGSVTADVTSLEARANIVSNGGKVSLRTVGNFSQIAGTRVDSGVGTMGVTVGGNMTVAQIITRNATQNALTLTVTGGLSVAAGQTTAQLVANATGALGTLRIGSLTPVGPEGLTVQLAEVDIDVNSGPLHLQELDGIILTSVLSVDGPIDIFANGETVVHKLNASGGGNIVVSTSTGNLIADNATISGGDVRLFAFGGAIAGETTDTFMGDMTAGVTGHFFARDDLRYTETAGDLRAGFALSDTGDLRLNALTGSMTLGVLGANGSLVLEAQGSLRVNIIGRATIDLADEVAMQLVEPSYYGIREARSPDTVELTAFGTGSTIYAGLVNAKLGIGLHADDIDAHLYDATPVDDLNLVIDDSTGDFAETVDVQSIGDGPVLFIANYFEDVRPRLAGRDASEGNLILTRGRIGTGQVTHAGPGFLGQDVIINGDVWFRQRSFDLFSHIDFVELSTIDDAQIYAINGGVMSFSISNEIVLTTENVLVLNRRLGGVDLNGGQGFAFGVGVETDILGYPFTFKGTAPGVTRPEPLRQLIEQHEGNDLLYLPQFLTEEDGSGLCASTYSKEPCLELSMLQ